ncbi:MAG: dihydroorotate dehydrogenase electron transfer subunit [Anaerolineae bacterium]|nr:dihydroorotate dehydrogenase electron transfer subunit [Anaerolineae bacterium]
MSPSPYLAGRVARVEPAGARAITVVSDLRLTAHPGQFVMLWLPRVDEKPFSLVDDDPVTLTIVEVGPFTRRLQGLQAGQPLFLRGPLGNGFSLAGERPLLVAGGSGAAALAFLARRLCEAGREVTVALGARTASELLLAGRYRAIGARLLVSTEDGSEGERGLVTALAERFIAEEPHDRVYACGPAPMLERVAAMCHAAGVPGELSHEAYMRCGIGVCGSCDRGDGLLVCRDGPVFPVPGSGPEAHGR